MKRFLRILLYGLAGLATMVGLTLFLLQTGPGARQVERLVESAVPDVALAGLDIDLGGAVALDSLQLSDRDGVWLSVEGLSIRWDWRPLLDRRLAVTAVDVDRLAVARAPVGGEDDTETAEAAGADPLAGLPRNLDLPVSLALDSLLLERIEIGPALAGQAVIARLEGKAAVARSGRADIDVALRREDGVGGAASLAVAADPATRALDLALSVAEPAGGVIVGLAGLPGAPPFEGTLDGAGDLDRWEGRLTLSAGEDVSADLGIGFRNVDLADGPSLGVTVAGAVVPGPLVPAEVGPQIGKEVALDLAARYGDGAVGLERLAVDVALGRLTLEGRLADTGDLDARARFSLARNAPLPAPFALAGGEIVLTAAGPLAEPDLTLTVELDTPGLGDPDLDALLGSRPALSLSGRLDAAGQTLSFDRVAVDTATAEVTGDGAVDLAGPTGSAVLDLAVPRLADLSALAGRPLDGAVAGTLVVDLGERLHVTADLEGSGIAVGDDRLDPLLPPRIGLFLAAEVPLDANAITVEALTLDAGVATLDASGLVDPEGRGSAIDAKVDVSDLGAFAGLAEMPTLSGSLSASLKTVGRLDDPNLSARVSAPRLVLPRTVARDVVLTVEASRIVSAPEARIAADASTDFGRLALRGDVGLSGETLRLDGVRLTRDAADRLEADATVDLARLLATGSVRLDLPDLAAYAEQAGQTLAGRIGGRVDLTTSGNRQDARVVLSGRDLAAAGGTVGRLDLEGSATDVLGDPFADLGLEADLVLANAALDANRLGTADLSVRGSLADLAVTLTADGGVAEDPVALDTQARLDLRAGAAGTIEALTARYGEIELALPEAASFALAGEKIRADVPRLTALGASLSASVDLDEMVTGNVRLSDLDLARLAPLLGPDATPIEGRVELAATLSGRADAPTVAAQLTIADATVEAAQSGPIPTVDGQLDLRVDQGRATVDAIVSGFAESPLVARASLPVALSLRPFSAAVTQDGGISGTVTWRGRTEELFRYVPVAGLRATGPLGLDLAIAGTVADPDLSGGLTWRQGTVASTLAGVTLDPVTLNLAGAGRELTLDLSATTPDAGRLSADGRIVFDTLANPQILIDIAAREAVVARREDVRAATNADIRIEGSPRHLDIVGEVAPTEVEVRLVDALPPSVVTLDVVPADAPPPEPEADPQPSRIGLDLTVPIERRLFVRGRGLDSEWAGRFRITGTAGDPVIDGELAPIRGSLSFAGRSFDINESVIRFRPGADEPELGIKAITQTTDVTAIVAVEGTPSDPEISFRSQPQLPRDEVLSRILFGKSTANLSQAEALRLAQAVATASSGEAGFTDVVRDTLGLDQLGFTGSEGGIGAVQAGRYVTEGVFVGVEQGPSANSTKVKVEVDVTDRVKVETEVGANTESRVGVTYEFEY